MMTSRSAHGNVWDHAAVSGSAAADVSVLHANLLGGGPHPLHHTGLSCLHHQRNDPCSHNHRHCPAAADEASAAPACPSPVCIHVLARCYFEPLRRVCMVVVGCDMLVMASSSSLACCHCLLVGHPVRIHCLRLRGAVVVELSPDRCRPRAAAASIPRLRVHPSPAGVLFTARRPRCFPGTALRLLHLVWLLWFWSAVHQGITAGSICRRRSVVQAERRIERLRRALPISAGVWAPSLCRNGCPGSRAVGAPLVGGQCVGLTWPWPVALVRHCHGAG